MIFEYKKVLIKNNDFFFWRYFFASRIPIFYYFLTFNCRWISKQSHFSHVKLSSMTSVYKVFSHCLVIKGSFSVKDRQVVCLNFGDVRFQNMVIIHSVSALKRGTLFYFIK